MNQQRPERPDVDERPPRRTELGAVTGWTARLASAVKENFADMMFEIKHDSLVLGDDRDLSRSGRLFCGSSHLVELGPITILILLDPPFIRQQIDCYVRRARAYGSVFCIINGDQIAFGLGDRSKTSVAGRLSRIQYLRHSLARILNVNVHISPKVEVCYRQDWRLGDVSVDR